MQEEIDALLERVERLEDHVAQLEMDMTEAFHRIRAADVAIVASTLALLQSMADTAGWQDGDITAFLNRRAAEARKMTSVLAPAGANLDEASLVELFREAATSLRTLPSFVPNPDA